MNQNVREKLEALAGDHNWEVVSSMDNFIRVIFGEMEVPADAEDPGAYSECLGMVREIAKRVDELVQAAREAGVPGPNENGGL